jgi:hypothetical protein
MNIIFSGGATRFGRIYDYCGFWSRERGRTSWKAIVRHSDVLCRPFGHIEEELGEAELLDVIREEIETSITEALCRKTRLIA